MSWLLLAALGMLWAAFLNPTKKASPEQSVRTFERDMGRLAAGETGAETPARRAPSDPVRAAARARARRRLVLGALVQAVIVSFLVGLAPDLRGAWAATGVFLFLLAGYVWLLLATRHQRVAVAIHDPRSPVRVSRPAPRPLVPDEEEDGGFVVSRWTGTAGR